MSPDKQPNQTQVALVEHFGCDARTGGPRPIRVTSAPGAAEPGGRRSRHRGRRATGPLITIRHPDPRARGTKQSDPGGAAGHSQRGDDMPIRGAGSAIEQAPIVISSDLSQRLFPRR